MDRLALPVEDESRLGFGHAALAVDGRAGTAAIKNRGETILLYRVVPETFVMYVGSGRIAGFDVPEKGELVCRLDQLRRFEAPVISDAEIHIPGVRRLLTLSGDRFGDIFDQVREAAPPATIAEAGAFFQHQRSPSLDVYLAVHDEVLRRWDYRCAVTGERFAPAARPHRQLRLAPSRPREKGGPLHVRNYLPMVEMAESAWLGGVISVSQELDFLSVLNRLPPDLLSRMRPEGRLLVPDDPLHWPDPEHLAYHRAHIFGA